MTDRPDPGAPPNQGSSAQAAPPKRVEVVVDLDAPGIPEYEKRGDAYVKRPPYTTIIADCVDPAFDRTPAYGGNRVLASARDPGSSPNAGSSAQPAPPKRVEVELIGMDTPMSPAEILTGCVNLIVVQCHAASAARGWWTDKITGLPIDPAGPHITPEKIALIHSEISEALEGDRKGAMDDHLPEFTSLEVELADAVIRIADLAGARKLRLGEALSAKMAYNAIRADHSLEARNAVGGKAY